MDSTIINSINEKIENVDVKLKDLIKQLVKDYNKKSLRIDKIIHQSDKQQHDLIKLNEKLDDSYKKLKIASETDKLTSLKNRLKCEELLTEYIEKHIGFSIMIVDIDNFKVINEKFDLLIANQVLVAMSKILNRTIDNKSIIGRWSGDSFMIIDKTSILDEVIDKAQEVCENVENSFFDDVGKITVSVGVSSSNGISTLKDIVTSFDNALKKAKNNGKNQVSI